MKFSNKIGLLFSLIFLLASATSCAQEKKSDTPSVAEETKTGLQGEASKDPSGIKWVALEDAQKQAKETGKKVLIFGYADWCTYCMKMRRETYTDETVRERLYEQFIPVQVNAEAETELVFNGETYKSWEFAQYMRLSSFPTHYFIDSDGSIIGAQPGFLPVEVFGPLMGYIGTDQFGKIGFEDYLKETENTVIKQ